MAPFRWSVYDGYVWCHAWRLTPRGGVPRDAPLVPRSGVPRDAPQVRVLINSHRQGWRHYYPLEDTLALYRTFADVVPTEAGVQAFAARYGRLGLGETVALDPADPFMCTDGEQLFVWANCIRRMRSTLMVWDALQRQDHHTLSQWVTLGDPRYPDWPKDERPDWLEDDPSDPDAISWSVQYPPESPFLEGVLCVEDPLPGIPRLGTPGVMFQWSDDKGRPPVVVLDPWKYALGWLRDQIAVHLRRHVILDVGYVKDSADPIPLALETRPKHLYGALWLQFALNVRGTERDQQCRQCGTWFRVPPKARRVSTAYCSARCRVRAARARQRHSAPV